MSSSRILVTGVAGFIASHLAERLLLQGQSVVGVDCFTDYYPRAMKEQHLSKLRSDARFHLIEADLVSADAAALLDGVDYVFHLAGQPGVRASWGREFEVYTRNNVLATQRLLEAAITAALKKFVFASSSSVYGDAERFPTSEDVVPHPISPYGVTKLASEHLVHLYARNYSIPTVSLRFFSVYGPRQRPDMAFHRFVRAIQRGAEITVYGDGEQTRDFTFVGDVVEGVMLAGFSPVTNGVFNLGGGSQVSLKHAIEILERIFNRSALIKHVQAQQGDARNTGADIRRARNAFSYVPRITLEEGLALQARAVESEL